MATIEVNINGNRHSLACRDGDEERLKALASFVDQRAVDLVGKLGQVTETKLILMTAIVIADELQEVLSGDSKGEHLLGQLRDQDVVDILDGISEQVDGIATKLASA